MLSGKGCFGLPRYINSPQCITLLFRKFLLKLKKDDMGCINMPLITSQLEFWKRTFYCNLSDNFLRCHFFSRHFRVRGLQFWVVENSVTLFLMRQFHTFYKATFIYKLLATSTIKVRIRLAIFCLLYIRNGQMNCNSYSCLFLLPIAHFHLKTTANVC